MENERNQYDKKDSLKIGNQAENSFAAIAEQGGWTVESANRQQNIYEHWDFRISKENSRYKVDVKARKRISRSDQDLQDEWIWIEIHSVRKNDQGWLFGGESDLIAFEQKDAFWLVLREDLKTLIPQKVEKIWVEKSWQAQYKLYRRKGRHDILTLIKATDLKEIIWEIWKK
ncbi:MAG: hypothetical protein R3E32_02870 [Chitinophagales bacterium]